MSWFTILKIMTPREFLEEINSKGNLNGTITGRQGSGQPKRRGTKFMLSHHGGSIKLAQEKSSHYVVNVNSGEKMFRGFNLRKIVGEVLTYLEENK